MRLYWFRGKGGILAFLGRINKMSLLSKPTVRISPETSFSHDTVGHRGQEILHTGHITNRAIVLLLRAVFL